MRSQNLPSGWDQTGWIIAVAHYEPDRRPALARAIRETAAPFYLTQPLDRAAHASRRMNVPPPYILDGVAGLRF